VRDPAVGTPVVLAWKAPCGGCRRCRSGANHLCERGMAVAAPRVRRDGEPLDLLLGTGCFAEYVVVPAGSAVPAPAALPPEEAALVGCAAATGVGAVLWTARVPAGATVAVWGAGGVGICVIAGARMAGAGVIVAVDPDPARRSEAMARGATAVTDPDGAAETIAAATDGRGLDFAFEVVGTVATMEHALAALGRGGELVLVGAAARDAELRFRPRAFMSLQQRITSCIYGSVRPAVELPVLLGWAADGTLRLGELIGARIAFDDLPGAFAAPPPGIRTVVEFAA
jgi:S-(hydroxymethyl)glutathione dehydrogenase / alcohol dehydrogenase